MTNTNCGLLKISATAAKLGGAMFGISTRWDWFLGIAMGGAIALGGDCALAQIKPIPDNTLGAESSVVTPNVAIRSGSDSRCVYRHAPKSFVNPCILSCFTGIGVFVAVYTYVTV